MILENKTTKILDFDRPRKLHPSKICTYTVSPRLQQMMLSLQKYDSDVKYVKGKYLHEADALSRALMDNATEEIGSKKVQLLMHTLVNNLPISET